MSTSEFDTSSLNEIIGRIRTGDKAAQNDLVLRMQSRLERLAKRMLRDFPRVGRWVEFEDVMQNALVRLLRALDEVKPEGTRALFGLAAEHLRRELIDLTRHFQGPQGLDANYNSGIINPNQPVDVPGGNDPMASDPSGDDLDRWRSFHEAVELLPVEQRETFSLVYYHGWTHQQIAELFQCSDRTIRRNWQDACRSLKERLDGKWTDPE